MDIKSTEINLSEYSSKKTSDEIGHEIITLLLSRQFHMRNLQELALLKDLLEKVGIQVKAYDYTDSNSLALSFNIDYSKYNTATTRKAGRKFSYNKEQEHGYAPCTVEELHERIKTNPNKSALAAELGCHRTTLYRILKKLEDNKWYEDDDYYRKRSIWSHTS